MAFCSNCGAKNAEDARFCSGCGKSIGGAAPKPVVNGMRTEAEVLDFFTNTLKYKGSYPKKYLAMLRPIIRSLMPDEVIVFPFVGAQNMTAKGGDMCGYAMTNRRMLIYHQEDSLRASNNAVKGRSTLHGMESHAYEEIASVTYDKGLLIGTIHIDLYTATGTISVDKKWVEQVYQGINEAVSSYRQGAY